jgi:hypothetical protein
MGRKILRPYTRHRYKICHRSMSPVLTILLKVFVREFYKVHASLFLLVIGLAGGFMRAPDHIMLGEFFISSPILLMIPVLVWILYTLKVISFNAEILTRKENEFLYHFSMLSEKDQRNTMLIATAYQLIPVYLYAVFLIALAGKHGFHSSTGSILLSVAALQFLVPFKLLRELQHPNRGVKVSRLRRLLNTVFVKPYPLFLIEWIVRRQFFTFAAFKIFSFFLLFGVIHLYRGEAYDLRLLGMATAAAMASHTTLICAIHRFENFHFAMIRQLPMTLTRRFTFLLMVIVLLMLPETALLVKNFPPNLPLSSLVSCYFFALSTFFFLYGMLYLKDRNEEQFMPIVFSCTMGWIVLILFKVPLWMLGGINLAAGLWVWRRYYYSFEYIADA